MFQPSNRSRFEAALGRFDEENGRDPNMVISGGKMVPRELAYAQWLTEWILKLAPEASEGLRLAARCQHLCRWLIPRQSYPQTRPGYLKWREDLKKFHATKAGEILKEVGYPPEDFERVQALNLKTNFPQDPESRVLEDALCLVFLEHQFAELADKTEEGKMIEVLRKTYGKMSKAGREWIGNLGLEEREKELVNKALNEK